MGNALNATTGHRPELLIILELPSSIQLDSLGISQILQPARVDFSSSDTQRDSCKIYTIKNEKGVFRLENCSTKVTIQDYKPIP